MNKKNCDCFGIEYWEKSYKTDRQRFVPIRHFQCLMMNAVLMTAHYNVFSVDLNEISGSLSGCFIIRFQGNELLTFQLKL